MARIGQLLALFRQARALQDIPPVEDEAAFRRWVLEAAQFTDDLGDHTESDADDRGGQLLRAIAADPDAWGGFYRQLLRYVGPGLVLPSIRFFQLAADRVDATLPEVLSVWMILAGAMRLNRGS